MKFRVDRDVFTRALVLAAGAADRKAVTPILASAKLVVEDDILWVSATDTAVSVSSAVSIKGEADGAVCASARRLLDVVKSLPAGHAVYTASEGWIEIAAARSRFKVPCSSAADFPALPMAEAATFAEVEAGPLHDAIKRASIAICPDDLRLQMAGVLLEGSGSDVTAAALDGHRMMKVTRELPGCPAFPAGGALVPRKAAAEIVGMLDGAGKVGLSVHDGHIMIRAGGATLSAKLTVEKFPPYRNVLDQAESAERATFTAKRAELCEAFSRAGLMSFDKGSRIAVAVAMGSITISATSATEGSAQEQVATAYAGPEVSGFFSHRYWSDALEAIAADEVKIELASDGNAVVIRPADGGATVAMIAGMR